MQIQGVADGLTNRCVVLGLKAETFEEERAIGFLYNVFHTPGVKITIETTDGEQTEINVHNRGDF